MTRGSIIILLLYVQGTVTSSAMDRATADGLAIVAQHAYEAGDHAEALRLYDSVNTVYTSPGLLFNMGNCHFKLQQIPEAILFYERALRLAPRDADIESNLELARQHIVDRVNAPPSSSFSATITRLTLGPALDRWAEWALVAWVVTLLLLAFGIWSHHIMRKRMFYASAGLGALATVVFIAFAAMRVSALQDRSEAIIFSPRIEVRSEPREGATTLFMLHKGTKVEIGKESGDWYEVSLRNGNVGWIPAQTFERI